MRVVPAAAVCCVAIVVGSQVRTAEPTAAELAKTIQRKYETIHDFTADFAQERISVLRKRLVERGKVYVKKPGKMRWEYKTPEEKLFIADGINTYMYIPQDRQVWISPLLAGDQATVPVLFLAGQGDLTRDFIPSIVDAPPGTRTLKLTPKTPQPEYDWLTLSVDQSSFALRGLGTMDPQGGLSTFTFTNLKENVIGTDNRQFVFKRPSGVDVVTDLSNR